MKAFGLEFEVPKDAVCIRYEGGRYWWYVYEPIMKLAGSNQYEWFKEGPSGMRWGPCDPWINRDTPYSDDA